MTSLSRSPSRSTPRSRCMVTCTGPFASCARKASASASFKWKDGGSVVSAVGQGVTLQAIVTKLPGEADDATFPTMTPIAPAVLAIVAFTEKLHEPRSMNAILPVSGVVIALQPSAGAMATTSPLMLNDEGPNAAVPVP